MINSSFGSRLRAWLNDLRIQDPVERRIAVIFQSILLGLIAVDILGMIVNLAIPSLSSRGKLIGAAANLLGALVIGLPLGLLRRGHVRSAALIIIIILFTTPTLAEIGAVDIPVNGGVLFQLTLAIILAGLLVSRRALALAFGLSAALVAFGVFQGGSAESQSATDGISIMVNFILLNGIIALFLDRFSDALRTALNDALEREGELQNEMSSRKQAEEEARLSQLRLSGLVASAMDGIVSIDSRQKIVLFNPAAEKMFGYQAEEALGQPLDILLPERYRATHTTQIHHFGRTGITSRAMTGFTEVTGLRRNGEEFPMDASISQVEIGGHKFFTVILRDITERKQAEEALRESQARYRRILDTMMEGCQIIDFDWHYLYVNQVVAAQQARLNPEEMLNHTVLELYPDVENTELFAVLRQCMEERVPAHLETQFSFPDGRLRWFELSIQPAREGIFILSTDITEHRQADQALREAEAKYRTLVEHIPAITYLAAFDETQSRLYVSPQIESLLGYTQEEYLRDSNLWKQMLHPDDRAWVLAEVSRFYETAEPFVSEYRSLARDGRALWFHDEAVIYEDAVTRRRYIQGVKIDISERKQAEEKIQRQNQRLKALREIDTAILSADSIENIVGAALDHIRELIDCQRAVLSLIDWEANETVVFDVRTDNETSLPQGTRVPLALFQNVSQTLSRNEPALITDLSVLADPPPLFQSLIKEGLRSVCILPLFTQGALIGSFSMASEIPRFFDEEKIALGREVANQVAIAITQNNLHNALREFNADLEQRVRERENLIAELTANNAELERFTYTVSHDLKSPLVTIKGFLGYLEEDALTGNVDRLKGDTKRIANAVEKMQELLNDLLELARIGRFVNPPEIVPYEELAREAIGLVEGRIRERGVTVELQSNLPAVYVDKRRLVEVLQNLLDNAAKYMGDQAHPLVEIGVCGEEDGKPIFFIKDNGMSIAPEYREKIFGLFNKLDVHSEGAGIGLALVRRIIEFHGGRIWIESEVGKGSAFCFTLPTEAQHTVSDGSDAAEGI